MVLRTGHQKGTQNCMSTAFLQQSPFGTVIVQHFLTILRFGGLVANESTCFHMNSLRPTDSYVKGWTFMLTFFF